MTHPLIETASEEHRACALSIVDAEEFGRRRATRIWVFAAVLSVCAFFSGRCDGRAMAIRALEREIVWAKGYVRLERECKPDRFEGEAGP